MTSTGDTFFETSIKSPGFAVDSSTTGFVVSAAISEPAASIGDLTASVFAILLEGGVPTWSAKTCEACEKANRRVADANPTFNLYNEKPGSLNDSFSIITPYLFRFRNMIASILYRIT